MLGGMKLLAVAVIAVSLCSAGVFFIFSRWQTLEVEPEIVSFERENKLEEISPDPVNEIVPQQAEEPESGSIEAQIRKLIETSENLIAQTKQFIEEEKNKETLVSAAKERSSQIKGLYMNEFVASSQSPLAVTYREKIKSLLDETELNGVVIDIKEAYGPNLPNSLKNFINELHQKDVWVIARICAFRDSSLREENPGLYLQDFVSTSSDDLVWQDPNGVPWLDPASPEVQEYIINFSKTAVDFGFDELQFDYIRFPSDGNLENIVYPFYDGSREKYEIIREFFSRLSADLKEYEPSIILSADLFGYVATQFQAFDIGQRLLDAGAFFDYVSFMTYPSHFYGGFVVSEDKSRGLPALNLPYEAEDAEGTVSANPYQVILRSVLVSSDFLSLYNLPAKVRPWLQDFNLNFDMQRGIYYTAEKIRDQIDGAEQAGSSGWILWNPSSVYTEETF